MARIPASEQTRKQIAEVLRGDFDKSALLRNAVRLIVEEAWRPRSPTCWGGATTNEATGRYPQWQPSGAVEDGRGDRGVCRAAGDRHGGAVGRE